MPQISTYPSDEVHQAIEEISEHHDIPLARAAELLIEEGLAARSDRYQTARLEAKLDRLLEEFAVDIDDGDIDKQAALRMAMGSPPGGVPEDVLSDSPSPPIVDWIRRGRGAVGNDNDHDSEYI